MKQRWQTPLFHFHPFAGFVLASVTSVGASFTALDRWLDARIGPVPPENEPSPPLLPRVLAVAIDPTLESKAYFAPGHSFAPYLDTAESTRERLVLRSIYDEVDVSVTRTVTELVIEQSPEGVLTGSLAQTEYGGCLHREGEPQPTPKPRLGRVVLTRDWFGAEEEYAFAFHRLSPDGTFYEPNPTWYRVRP